MKHSVDLVFHQRKLSHQVELESVSLQLEEFHAKAATYDMAVMER